MRLEFLSILEFATLLVSEAKKPLRKSVEPVVPHNVRNLLIGVLGAASVSVVQKPLLKKILALAEHQQWGLIPRLRLTSFLKSLLSILLMDYTLYLWHMLTHKNKFLWRFHEAHHRDLDLTTTTGLRFHFAELLLSIPWRMAQVCLIGITAPVFKLWQILTLMEVIFHHSNVQLPEWLEKKLALFIVTPRMHGIHHSQEKSQRDSNWSSGVVFWDLMHRTYLWNIPQETIEIGTPRSSYQDAHLKRILLDSLRPHHPYLS